MEPIEAEMVFDDECSSSNQQSQCLDGCFARIKSDRFAIITTAISGFVALVDTETRTVSGIEIQLNMLT